MIIVAIDEIDLKKATEILSNLDSKKCMVKIGSVAFNSIGHDLVLDAAKKDFGIFLDLKLHDIPNTVKKSIQGLTSLPIQMLTIHTSGGKDMMRAAMEAVSGNGIKALKEAGLEVHLVSEFEADAEQIIRGFIYRLKKKRPYITLKIATSLDGKLATGSGESKWISNIGSIYI